MHLFKVKGLKAIDASVPKKQSDKGLDADQTRSLQSLAHFLLEDTKEHGALTKQVLSEQLTTKMFSAPNDTLAQYALDHFDTLVSAPMFGPSLDAPGAAKITSTDLNVILRATGDKSAPDEFHDARSTLAFRVALGAGSLCFTGAKRFGANLGLSLGAGAACGLGVAAGRMAYENLSGDNDASYYAQKANQLAQLDLRPILGISDFRPEPTGSVTNEQSKAQPIAKPAPPPKSQSAEPPKTFKPLQQFIPEYGWETDGSKQSSLPVKKHAWGHSSVLDSNGLDRVLPVK